MLPASVADVPLAIDISNHFGGVSLNRADMILHLPMQRVTARVNVDGSAIADEQVVSCSPPNDKRGFSGAGESALAVVGEGDLTAVPALQVSAADADNHVVTALGCVGGGVIHDPFGTDAEHIRVAGVETIDEEGICQAAVPLPKVGGGEQMDPVVMAVPIPRANEHIVPAIVGHHMRSPEQPFVVVLPIGGDGERFFVPRGLAK